MYHGKPLLWRYSAVATVMLIREALRWLFGPCPNDQLEAYGCAAHARYDISTVVNLLHY